MNKCAMNWDKAKEADAAGILESLKEEVKNIAKSKRDMITPKPLEADKVKVSRTARQARRTTRTKTSRRTARFASWARGTKAGCTVTGWRTARAIVEESA